MKVTTQILYSNALFWALCGISYLAGRFDTLLAKIGGYSVIIMLGIIYALTMFTAWEQEKKEGVDNNGM